MTGPQSISCLCLTYGRTKLLEESLQSFINYEYEGDYELLILNDFPEQEIIFDHPRVRIINCADTFKTWGAKEDFGINMCKYDTIIQHDDDDIGFPDLLKVVDRYFDSKTALMHWNKAVFWNGHRIIQIRAVGNSGIVFSRDAVEKIGGYPHFNAGADTIFVRSIDKAGLNIKRVFPNDDEVSWNYRWGMPNYNCSGQGSDAGREEEDQIISRHSKFVENQVKAGKEPVGRIELNPHWDKDYFQMYKDYIKKNPEDRKINPNNLNGYAIGEEILEWLRSRLKKEATVLEFGSGRGTIELAKFFNVISVEHNKKWAGLSNNATYVLTELKDGAYDMEPVYKAINGKKIDAVIIDGPPGHGNRNGILSHIKNFRNSSIIVDDTHRPREVKLAMEISKLVGRKNLHMEGHEKAFDVI